MRGEEEGDNKGERGGELGGEMKAVEEEGRGKEVLKFDWIELRGGGVIERGMREAWEEREGVGVMGRDGKMVLGEILREGVGGEEVKTGGEEVVRGGGGGCKGGEGWGEALSIGEEVEREEEEKVRGA